MSDPISSLRNMGPAMEQAFARVGITSVAQLRALGADAAYARLLAHGTRPHFIGYYIIEMALQDRPWNDAGPEEKAGLRRRFDALKAGAGTAPGRLSPTLERMLDQIGVLPRRA